MYLHIHTVLNTLWAECKHTYSLSACMRTVHTQPHVQLRLVRGNIFYLKFSCSRLSAPFAPFAPSPRPLPLPRPHPGCLTPTAAGKHRIMELVYTNNRWPNLSSQITELHLYTVKKPKQYTDNVERKWYYERQVNEDAARQDTHCQVVTEQLHDQGAVFVGFTAEGVQLAYGVIKCLGRTHTYTHTQKDKKSQNYYMCRFTQLTTKYSLGKLKEKTKQQEALQGFQQQTVICYSHVQLCKFHCEKDQTVVIMTYTGWGLAKSAPIQCRVHNWTLCVNLSQDKTEEKNHRDKLNKQLKQSQKKHGIKKKHKSAA